jgi:hypothetical protein
VKNIAIFQVFKNPFFPLPSVGRPKPWFYGLGKKTGGFPKNPPARFRFCPYSAIPQIKIAKPENHGFGKKHRKPKNPSRKDPEKTKGQKNSKASPKNCGLSLFLYKVPL